MPRYSSIVTALISRLTAHNATGQILEGWKFVSVPEKVVEGRDDAANGVLRVWFPDIKEKAHDQLAIITGGVMTIKLSVSTLKTSGIAAHVLGCEKVMDACQLNVATIDLLLGSTLAKPMELTSCGDSFIPDDSGGLSMNSHILLTLVPKAFKAGARRS